MKIKSCFKPYMIHHFCALLILLSGICPCPVEGHMGARYEPNDGRVIHGLGQYVHQFYTDLENWQYVNEYIDAVSQTPVIFSVYTYLDPAAELYHPISVDVIRQNSGKSHILNIGIALQSVMQWQEGNIFVPVQSILAGDWDGRILALAAQIKAIGAPTFVRPGFEFGINNSGAHAASNLSPEQFKAIWIRIHNLFADAGVDNVAWVWNTVNPWMFDYMQWYPGDTYVDWWGINYFTVAQMNQSDPFVIAAGNRQKPVMVCEASPINNGGTSNAANWAGWFEPFFNKIKAFNHIKGFIYISDPWDRPGWWEVWADSRINLVTTQTQIRSNFALELSDPRYIHLQEYLDNPVVIPVTPGNGNDDNNGGKTGSNSGGGCFITGSANSLRETNSLEEGAQ